MNSQIKILPPRVFIMGDVRLTHEQEIRNVAHACGVIWHNQKLEEIWNDGDSWSHVRECIDACKLVLIHVTEFDTYFDAALIMLSAAMYGVGRGIPVVVAMDPGCTERTFHRIKSVKSAFNGKLYRFVGDDAVPALLEATLLETGLGRRAK